MRVIILFFKRQKNVTHTTVCVLFCGPFLYQFVMTSCYKKVMIHYTLLIMIICLICGIPNSRRTNTLLVFECFTANLQSAQCGCLAERILEISGTFPHPCFPRSSIVSLIGPEDEIISPKYHWDLATFIS